MTGYGNKTFKISALAHLAKAVDVFNKDHGQVDLHGRIRTTYRASASLEPEGLQLTMTGSAGEFGHFVIPWNQLPGQDDQFTPSQVRQMLEAMSRKLRVPFAIPSDILVPRHFTGI